MIPRPVPGTIDSHFHYLSTCSKDPETDQKLLDLYAQGFAGLLDIGIDMEHWDRRTAAAEDHTQAGRPWFLAEGLHPAEAGKVHLQPEVLRQRLTHPQVLALGEIGLDWYRGRDTQVQQQDLFEQQLDLARQVNLPVIIHCREAEDDVFHFLKAAALPRAGIMHCFSGDLAFAKKCLDLGFFISFAGNLTYPKAENLHHAAKNLPVECLLIETDAPYLAPQPVRGKPNHSANLVHTLDFLAQLRQVPTPDLALQLKDNFTKLFPAARV